MEIYAEGRKAVFSARTPGEYRFVIACAKGDTVDVITHVIKVIGPPATPVTDSLAEWIPVWLWPTPMPHEECVALADSFEAVAGRIHSLLEARDWIRATADANRKVLGDRIDAWAPFLDKLGAALLKKAQDGALFTPEDHQKVWLEIAEGLRKC